MKKKLNKLEIEKLQKNEIEWKKRLTDEQYYVLRQKGTEPPFTGNLLYSKENGTYVCTACGNPLFSSDTKFDSGTGWPSFDQALLGSVEEVVDKSMHMHRTEIICARCHSHLGHVFNDGPTKTHKRYCTNSISLELISNNKN